MFFLLYLISIGTPVLPSLGALLFSPLTVAAGASVMVALIALYGVLYSQRAPLQAALNIAFSDLTTELQEERAQLIARISELDSALAQSRLECLQKDGEIRGLKQSRDSLLALLKNSGILIPGESPLD